MDERTDGYLRQNVVCKIALILVCFNLDTYNIFQIQM